ncbi:hypothetical protein B0H17DRAFT_988358 [Mycena rosella]|uniref:Ribosomal protein/NADH dehydrogenase domain-containing protein n=1 Tax=Mycena rosella TaxID=1033263 RepID=A0AAD7D1L3_MYCRO|nr:hypothetical protein B0H17DRAFT_988358 [Mycena rosella]
MVRGKRILQEGPSRLAQLVSHLKAPPKLSLPYLSSLRLTLATRNDHFGARHFLKEQLPRIRYANPDLNIEVRKAPKRAKDEWRPELRLSFYDGKTQTLNLHARLCSAILRELMDSAGSPAWARWKAEAARAGLPLVPGVEPELASTVQTREPRFSYDEWRAKHPPKVRRRRGEPSTRETKAKSTVQTKRKKDAKQAKAAPAAPEPVEMDAETAKEKAKEEDDQRRAAKKEARRAKLDAPRLAEEEAERRVALELLSKPRTGAAAVLP